ncbi:MAG: bifunctional folylpolyglutamate synthase/dihydrofolate synthase, partial [Chlorobi bacterium]|nr:bifunctional folylpolyglutamate synthase/dihydrofolate synthase [Chlorobiota bacterium]
MNYKETLDFLFAQLPMYQRVGKAAYKANLNNTYALDKYFKHPHTKYKTIHVAGTNGKGSVSHMLSSVLQSAGYKVGLYTSPHLLDFRERIKINGNMISEDAVNSFVSNNTVIIKKIQPSFFELSVAMAFNYFAEENVDIAVVEVGLGGRLDSTNIIMPELSIITNIGIDHIQFLGENIEDIAFEKAGIIKENIPVVIGKTQEKTKQMFKSKANQQKAKIFFADKNLTIDYSLLSTDNYQMFNIKKSGKIIYKNLKLDLLGEYQKENIITTLIAIEVFNNKNTSISNNNIYKGLANVIKNTGLQGRWQILEKNPLIICDTAHNIDGIKQVIKQINNTAYKNLHIVFGMVNDKSRMEILNILPKNATYYVTKASVPRALDEKILFSEITQLKLKSKYYKNVEKAIIEAKNNAEKNDLIYIGGS